LKRSRTKQLSNAQHFSKLYYPGVYKKPITRKWRKTYIAYYKNLRRTAADVDAAIEEDVVIESILKDLKKGLLDTTLPESSDEDDEEGSDQDEKEEDSGETYDDIKVPASTLWYRNTIMNSIWGDADVSEREAVEQHKMKVKADKETIDEMDDEGKRVKKLLEMMEFVKFVPHSHTEALNELPTNLGPAGVCKTSCLISLIKFLMRPA
jgi:hypothetical protein